MKLRLRQLRRTGFTLIEVMLSLAIVLVLLIGINLVFSRTSAAIGSGNTLNELTRNARAATPTLFQDFGNCASDSPVFVITSRWVPQFLNNAAYKANNNAGISPVVGCATGDNYHRLDGISFFARGNYTRRAPNDNFSLSATHSGEAFIHYGHVSLLASNGIAYINPENSSNFMYASDWALGKNVTVLGNVSQSVANANAGAAGPAIPSAPLPDASGYEKFFPQSNSLIYTPAPGVPVSMTNLSPLTAWSGNFNPYGKVYAAQPSANSSRYDLAGVTLEQFRSIVTDATYTQSQNPSSAAYAGGNAPFFWWQSLVYANTPTGSATVNPVFKNTYTAGPAAYPYAPQLNNAAISSRYQASSSFGVQPFSTSSASADVAYLSPILLEHCSQFIVEFAGDFVTQSTQSANLGEITDTTPDGQIDWMYDTKGDYQSTYQYRAGDYAIDPTSGTIYQAQTDSLNVPLTASASWAAVTSGTLPPRKIRWYGMPRDAIGTKSVQGYFSGIKSVEELANVVPLLDVWQCSANNSARALPYEVETGPTLGMPTGASVSTDYYNAMGTNGSPRYTAVWQNSTPAMVRILLKLDDANNDLASGPWFEFVFKLK